MKLLFAGTPDFAVPTLKALQASSHQLSAVYTQPDRPSGRGLHLKASPVKQYALSQGLPVHQPEDLQDPEIQAQMKAYRADCLVVVAYGLILPKAILSIPRFGCLNLHASLLPKWRGASPIVHSLLSGDTQAGISIMQMDKGMDTGPIWKQVIMALKGHETSAELSLKLSELGAESILDILTRRQKKPWETPSPQSYDGVSYAKKIKKSMARIDFSETADQVERGIRAFNPWPIAWTNLNQTILRVWGAEILPQTLETHPPGTVLDSNASGIEVATGHYGVLRLTRLQRAGGNVLNAAECLRGYQHGLVLGEQMPESSS